MITVPTHKHDKIKRPLNTQRPIYVLIVDSFTI